MGWIGIGWWIALGLGALGTAVTYLWPSAREFGYVLLAVAILSFAAAAVGAALSGWPHLQALRAQLGTTRMMLLFGIVGTWAFISFTLGIAAWMVAHPTRPANAAANDEGPISWVYNLSMERAGLNGINIASLRFQGANISKKHVRLKDAAVTSLIDGTRLPLEVVASDPKGDPKLVEIDKI